MKKILLIPCVYRERLRPCVKGEKKNDNGPKLPFKLRLTKFMSIKFWAYVLSFVLHIQENYLLSFFFYIKIPVKF